MNIVNIVYLKLSDIQYQYRVVVRCNNKISKKTMETVKKQAQEIISANNDANSQSMKIGTNVVELEFEKINASPSEITKHLDDIITLSAPLSGLGGGVFDAEEINKLELLFAMHLFQHGEKELLENKGLILGLYGEHLPLVEVLRIWIGFLQQIKTKEASSSRLVNYINALKDLLAWEEEIITIRETSNEKERSQKTETLAKKMYDKWQKATKSKESPLPFFIPAARNILPGIETPAILELSSLGEDKFKLQAVGVLGDEPNKLEIAMTEFTLDNIQKKEAKKDANQLQFFFKELIAVRLDMPITGVEKDISAGKKPGLLSVAKTVRKAIQSPQSFEPQMTLEKFLGLKNIERESRYSTVVGAEKSLEVFLKETGLTDFKKYKLILKIGTLFSLYAKGSDRLLTQAEFRQWLRKNCQSVAETLQKKSDLLSGKDAVYIKNRLSEIVKHIDLIESSQEIVLPKKPLGKASTSFDERLDIADVIPLREVKTSDEAIEEDIAPKELAFNSLDLNKIKKFALTWNKMANKGKFHELDLQLSYFFEQLEKFDSAWDKIPKEKSEEWSAVFLDISKVVMRCNYGLGNIVPESRHFLEMLRCFSLAETLYRQNFPEELFAEKFQFDIIPIVRVMTDRYFNLGADWSKAIALINTHKYSKRDTRMFKAWCQESYSEDSTYLFFEKMAEDIEKKSKGKAKDVEQLKKEVASDIGQKGHLSLSLANLRQMHILLSAMSSPDRALMIGDVSGAWQTTKKSMKGTDLGKMISSQMSEMIGSDSESSEHEKIDFEKTVYKKAIEADKELIAGQLSTRAGEVRIEAGTTMIIDMIGHKGLSRPSFIIHPWNVHVVDTEANYGDRNSEKPSNYYASNDIRMHPELAELLFEQVVGSSEASLLRPGKALKYQPDYYEPWIRGRPQGAIMRERKTIAGIAPEALHELQMIRSGGQTQRFKESIGKLSKHAHLLEHRAAGSTLRRFFETNLFHRGAFVKTIVNDPKYLPQLIEQLDRVKQTMKDRGDLGSYLFIIDLLQQMEIILIEKGYHEEEIKKLNNLLVVSEEEILEFIDEADKKGSPLLAYRQQLHAYRLLIAARKNELPQKDHLSLLESYCITKQWFEADNWLSGEKMHQIDYLLFKLSDSLSDALNNLELDKFAKSLDNSVPDGMDWKRAKKTALQFLAKDSKGSEYLLDLKQGMLWKDKTRRGLLGQEILSHPDFSSFQKMLKSEGYPSNLEDIPARIRKVKIGKKSAVSGIEYAFTIKNQKNKTKQFRLIIDHERKLSCYRFESKSAFKEQWSKWLPKLETLSPEMSGEEKGITGIITSAFDDLFNEQKLEKKVPLNFLNRYACWISEEGKKIHFEESGTIVFEADISNGKISALKDRNGMQVVIPWDDPGYKHFLAIEDPAHILVKKNKEGEPVSVSYSRLGIEYIKRGDRWEVTGLQEYYLSKKSLSDHFEQKTSSDESRPAFVSELSTLFNDSFRDYHLLQHDNGPLKILVNCDSYEVKKGKKGSFSLIRTKEKMRRLEPSFRSSESSSGNPFIFTVDPNKGLVADKEPEGYLYLSYLLAVQGNYADGLRYLQKGMLHREFSEQSEIILSWINNLPKSSPEAIAFLYQASLMRLQHAEQLNVSQMPIRKMQKLIEQHKKIKVGFEKIKDLLPQSATGGLPSGDSILSDTAFANLPTNSACRQLRKKIDTLAKQLPKGEIVKTTSYTKPQDIPIPVSKDEISDVWLLEIASDKSKDRQQLIDDFKKKMEEIDDPFALEMAKARVEDLEYVLKQEKSAKAIKPLQIPSFLIKVENEIILGKDAALKYKSSILGKLPPPKTREGDELLSLLKRQKKQWNEVVLDTALRCFGEGDWTAIKKIDPEIDIKALSDSIKDYLLSATALMQKEKTMQALKELQNIEQDSDQFSYKSNEALSYYQAARYYDPDKDIDAPTNLLLEYELGIVLRKNQLEAVRKTIANPHLFIQVICGEGKSTVIRNILTHIRADGNNLAAVSTLEPLRQTHSLLYARTTLHAFGQKVFEFKWDRQTPSDELSLLRLHYNLLATIKQRSRCDFTRSDLLSFKHSETLKRDRLADLAPNDLNAARLQRELDVMEDIRDLMKERMVVMSDELDKDCDPIQEKNFSSGALRTFDSNQTKAALQILEWILTDPELKELKEKTQTNQQDSISEEQKTKYLEHIAKNWFDAAKNKLKGADEQSFINYMTGMGDSKTIDLFFDKFIKGKTDDKQIEQICYGSELLRSIIPVSLKKVSGVDFGRSIDLIHVIPYEGSDKPKEGSEHSSEALQIWLTCMDYSQRGKGLTTPIVEQIINNIKKEALQELREARLNDPATSLTLNNTETGKRFNTKFKKPLSEFQTKDCKTFLEEVEKDPKLLIEFIGAWIFPQYQLSAEKIVGTAQDMANMVRVFGGASGTESSKRALPDSVDISDVMQPGSYGVILKAVIDNEIKNSKKGIETYNSYSSQEDLIDRISKFIKNGDCITDVGIAFPGVPAEDIVEQISKRFPKTTFRYLNSYDEWKMMRNSEVIPFDSSIEPGNVITLFDDTHTRGAERPSVDSVTEWLTIGEKTGVTRFEQGISRERKVLQGKAAVVFFFPETIDTKDMSAEKLYERLLKKEAEQLRSLHDNAEKQRIRSIVPNQIDLAMRSITKDSRKKMLEGKEENSHHEARGIIFKHCRSYFIKKTKASAQDSGRPARMVSSKDRLDHLIEDEIIMLKDLKNGLITAAQEIGDPKPVLSFLGEIKGAKDLLIAKLTTESTAIGKPRLEDKYYSKKVPDSSLDMESTQESEKESEEEMELEQETEQARQISGDKSEYKNQIIDFNRLPDLFKMKYDDKKQFFKFTEYSSFQPKNKFFTDNYSNASNCRSKPWGIVTNRQNTAPDQNLISRTLFMIDPKTGCVIEVVTSICDNNRLNPEFFEIMEKKTGLIYSIYNYDIGAVDQGDRWDDFDKEKIKEIKRTIVSTMFQRGDLNYPKIDPAKVTSNTIDLKNLYPDLVDWLKDQPDLAQLKYSFMRFQKAHFPGGGKFQGSDLARAFKEAEEIQKQKALEEAAKSKPKRDLSLIPDAVNEAVDQLFSNNDEDKIKKALGEVVKAVLKQDNEEVTIEIYNIMPKLTSLLAEREKTDNLFTAKGKNLNTKFVIKAIKKTMTDAIEEKMKVMNQKRADLIEEAKNIDLSEISGLVTFIETQVEEFVKAKGIKDAEYKKWMIDVFTATAKIIVGKALRGKYTTDNLVAYIDGLLEKSPEDIAAKLALAIDPNLSSRLPPPFAKMIEGEEKEGFIQIFKSEIMKLKEGFQIDVKIDQEALKIAEKLNLEKILEQGQNILGTIIKQAWKRGADTTTGSDVENLSAKIIADKLKNAPSLTKLNFTHLTAIAMQAMKREGKAPVKDEIVAKIIQSLQLEKGVAPDEELILINSAIVNLVEKQVDKWLKFWENESDRNRFLLNQIGKEVEPEKEYSRKEVRKAIQESALRPIKEKQAKSKAGIRFIATPFRAILNWYIKHKAGKLADNLQKHLKHPDFGRAFLDQIFEASRKDKPPDLSEEAKKLFPKKTAKQVETILPKIFGEKRLIDFAIKEGSDAAN